MQRRFQSNKALAERFQQILEDRLKDTPKSLVDENPRLKQLYDEYSSETAKDRQFRDLHQQLLGLTRSEKLLQGNKHAKDIADTVTHGSWKGQELVKDASLRLILDSKPRAKALPTKKHRIELAIDSSANYKLGQKAEDEWREMYKERLLGPLMLINASSPSTAIGLVTTLADARISASIDKETGKFNAPGMDTVRGKPLDREHLANSTDTNYFVNQILRKQEVLPPWIDNQQGIDREIEVFRRELDSKWFNHVVDSLRPTSKDDLVAQVSNLQPSSSFKASQWAYVVAKTDLINKSIRTYNLQCPSLALHKFKLTPDTELDTLFTRMKQTIRERAEKRYERKVGMTPMTGGLSSMLGLFDDGPGGSGKSNSLLVWQSVKEMFKGSPS